MPVTSSSIGRTLTSIGWTKKKIRRVAKGCKANLRDLYLHNISEFVCRLWYLDLHFTVISLRWMTRSVGVFKFHEIGRREASSLPVMTDW